MSGLTVRWLATGNESEDRVLSLAASELRRYVRALTGERLRKARARSYDADKDAAAWLGVCDRLAPPDGRGLEPSVWDDGYAIWCKGKTFHVAGRNPRSVLFGVYDFLQRQGVRFLRPGRDGEIVPRDTGLTLPKRPIVECASHRHRGITYEGALSVEHALQTVAWCAKKRLNTIFLQFQSSQCFYNNYYGRPYRPASERGPVSFEEAQELDDRVIAAAKERGIVIHRVGHGWTSEAFGLVMSGWAHKDEMPAGKERYAALVGGKRGVFHKVPINTELCYSHPPAFDAMVEAVVSYAEKHPEVDVVHVWLSDASSNKCECDDCRKRTIADWYVRVMKAISAGLRRRAPGTRAVFLSYIELWWPPAEERFDETNDNLILMFAPIARKYSKRLADETDRTKPRYPRPELNRFQAPQENAFYAWSLAQWRKVFPGDNFDFDYHLMWANWHQLLDTRIARLLHDDIGDFEALGLHGLVSCQSWRVFYPTGMAMTVMADALWDPSTAWEARARDFYREAYGEAAAWARRHVARLEQLIPVPDSHRQSPVLAALTGEQLKRLADYLGQALEEVHERRMEVREAAHRRSLDLLLHHIRLLWVLVEAQRHAVAGHGEDALERFARAREFVHNQERRFGLSIDTMLLEGFYIDPLERQCREKAAAG